MRKRDTVWDVECQKRGGVKNNEEPVGTVTYSEAPPQMLPLMQEGLDKACGTEETTVLKPEPERWSSCARRQESKGTRSVCSGCLRPNLFRLRGRWREGISGNRAPSYVECVTYQGLRTRESIERGRGGDRQAAALGRARTCFGTGQ